MSEPWPAPSNEEEFEALMRHIDAQLKADEVPVPARPLRGASEVAKLLQRGLPLGPLPKHRKPVTYTGIDLAIRIFRWFDDQYGKRLAVDWRQGQSVVLLRGDPWELRVPRFYGRFRFFASTTEQSDPSGPHIAQPGSPPPRFNVLDSVTHLPDGLRRSLSEAECKEVLLRFREAMEHFRLIESAARESALAAKGATDLESATRHLVTSPPELGLSRWASLQASEKYLKAMVASSGASFSRVHRLDELAREAVQVGMRPIPKTWTDIVQCSASVRYGENSASLPEVVSALQAAVRICAHAASYFVKKIT